MPIITLTSVYCKDKVIDLSSWRRKPVCHDRAPVAESSVRNTGSQRGLQITEPTEAVTEHRVARHAPLPQRPDPVPWLDLYLHSPIRLHIVIFTFRDSGHVNTLNTMHTCFWLAAVGIRHADHVAASIHKSWQSLRRQAAVARSV
jgi:hypothetical protein